MAKGSIWQQTLLVIPPILSKRSSTNTIKWPTTPSINMEMGSICICYIYIPIVRFSACTCIRSTRCTTGIKYQVRLLFWCTATKNILVDISIAIGIFKILTTSHDKPLSLRQGCRGSNLEWFAYLGDTIVPQIGGFLGIDHQTAEQSYACARKNSHKVFHFHSYVSIHSSCMNLRGILPCIFMLNFK